MAIQVILVPAGAEYQAVMGGLKRVAAAPPVVPVPAGPVAFRAFLETWEYRSRLVDQEVLLLGLGGSLSPEHRVGDAVLLERVWRDVGGDGGEAYGCDRALTEALAQRLRIPAGTGVTRDCVVTTVAEKRRLGDRYRADVVDMESAVLLETMPQAKIAILRVISDDCSHDLPDISDAIGPDGRLRADILARRFLNRPIAALNFISNSLQGLTALKQVSSTLFQ
ncbi:MAG: hypothetical protein WBA99_12020 [Nodosilinea sp.]